MSTFATLLIYIFSVIGLWKIFEIAGEKGFWAIIPLANLAILFKITWGRKIYALLTLIPVVGFIVLIITYSKLSKAFGHGLLCTLGLIFLNPIFTIILGFSSDEYQK